MYESKSFYLWLLQVIALLGLTALILWLSSRPKSPSYTIVDFYILDLNGTAATLSDGDRNSTISFNLEIANPNKESGIYYDNINNTLHLGDMYIGSTNIDPFYQGFHKTANRKENIVADRGFRKAVFRAVRNGTADLKMGVVTRVRYRIWAWKTRHHGLGFQGHVKVGSDGKIYGNKKVKLHHVPKKWRRR